MLLIILFDYDADLIDVPILINDMEKYQNLFFEWLFNKSIDHVYWLYKDGEKYGCSYRSEAFVDWLNNNPLKHSKEKAKIVLQFINEYNKELPILCF